MSDHVDVEHGTFDCIGLPLRGWAEVSQWVVAHKDEIRPQWLPVSPAKLLAEVDAPADYLTAIGADGWLQGRWRDPSGAEVTVNVSTKWEVEAVPSLDAPPGVRVTDLYWVEGTWGIAADVVDDEGELVTRLVGDSAQWRLVPGLDPDEVFLGVVTATARDVTIYADTDAFHAAPDPFFGDRRPSGPDGKLTGMGTTSFFPTGMFNQPMDNRAILAGVVVAAEDRINSATGVPFRAAEVRTLADARVHVCWPLGVAPLPEPGNVLFTHALLSLTIPALWERHSIP